MRPFLLALIAVSLFATAASAQPAEQKLKLDEKTLAAARDLGGSILGWVRSDVLPVALTWKQQLDAAITPADLRELNALRARATALRESAVGLGAGMRDAWQSEDYTALKQRRADLKKIGAERAALMKELKPLAEKYRTTLKSIGEAARPKAKEWGSEVKKIGAAWWQEHRAELDPQAARAIGNLMSRRQDMLAMFGPGTRQKAMVARFMLWDGTDFTRQIQDALDRGDIGRARGLDLD